MSLAAEPYASGPIVLTQKGIVIKDWVIEEPRLQAWLAEMAPAEWPHELQNILRLGLALKLNNQIQNMNEALKHTAEATLEQWGAKLETAFHTLDSKLQTANQQIDHVLINQVSGDNSALKATMSGAFEQLHQSLAQSRQDLVQALDPKQTASIGAQLDERFQVHLRSLADQTLGPKMDAISQAIVRLEATLANQERLKAERQRGTAKGTGYEFELLDAIQNYALPQQMLVRRVADEKGVNGTKDGDLVIDYNGRTLVAIECKDAKTSKLDQLQSALLGRQAQVGIMAHRHPNGPTAHISQNSVRIVGDNQILLVWDPTADDPALLTAVIGLAVLVAQRMAMQENRPVDDIGVDLEGAQQQWELLMDQLDLTEEVIRHFDLIAANADKGKKAVDKLKREWAKRLEQIAASLGWSE